MLMEKNACLWKKIEEAEAAALMCFTEFASCFECFGKFPGKNTSDRVLQKVLIKIPGPNIVWISAAYNSTDS